MSGASWRIAGAQDAATLSELGRSTFVETFGHLYSAEDLATFLENHSEESWRDELQDERFVVRIGNVDGLDVAYCKLGPPSLPVEAQGPAIELRQLYILKPWQGAGLANELMDWALAEARGRGAEELYLSVYIDNVRARRFYERYGFEFVGDYAFMVGTQADHDLIMRLKLA